MNDKRLVVSVDQFGTVVSVQPGSRESLFGFTQDQVLGQRLSAFVDVFEMWEQKYPDDELGMMVHMLWHAPEHLTQGVSWRVGVKQPSTKRAVYPSLHMPAIMTVNTHHTCALINTGDKEHSSVLEIALWRADTVVGAVEVDRDLHVLAPNAVLGLALGVDADKVEHSLFGR